MAAVVRAAALASFGEVASGLGLDHESLLREVGLDPRVLTQPERRIRSRQLAELLEISARRSGRPEFGVRLIDRRRFESVGLMGRLIAHKTTLREVLEALVAYRRLMNEAQILVVEEERDLARLRHELVIDPPMAAPQACEMVLGSLVKIVRQILGPGWQPLRTEFAHAAPPDLTFHRAFFGPGVAFGSDVYSLVFPRSDLDRPNPGADPALVGYLTEIIEGLPLARPEPMAEEVRKAIYQLLRTEPATLECAATRLGEHPRTLQRRLAAEGTSFSTLLNEVRRSLVTRLLANPRLPIAQISASLGYAQPSAFARWFVSEFGSSASAYRAMGRPRAP